MARKPQNPQPNNSAVAEEAAASTPKPEAKGPKKTVHEGGIVSLDF